MEELVPVFEKEGINLNIEPHPEDWCETIHPAVDMVRMIGSKNVKFLYCAPHTFYFGDDIPKMIGDAAPAPRACPCRRYLQSQGVVGPAIHLQSTRREGDDTPAHGHWSGGGELGPFFSSLAAVGFDGIMTSCVFAWEERADKSGRYMRETMQKYVDKYWTKPKA